MGRRRHVERGFNPWTGFVLSKVRTPKKTPDKRPYSDEELLRLFEAPPIRRAGGRDGARPVSGARIEELCSLRMKDVQRKLGAYFVTLRTGKGKTQMRTIAVTHDAPSEVLVRRWNPGKGADTQLFPSFRPGGYDGKLSWAHRDALGLPREVDFHSFRRTLMSALENLGVDQVATARYVGHTLTTLAFAVYSGGSSEKTMRAVAKAITYSPEVESAVGAFQTKAVTRLAKAA